MIAEMLLKSHSFSKEELIRLHSFHSLAKQAVPGAISGHSALLIANPNIIVGDEDDSGFWTILENEPERRVYIPDVKEYRLVITTCSLLGTLQLRENVNLKYSHIFIDEAGQCTEPEALIPITFIDPKIGQIILAGDPKQLGPVVMSLPAKNRNLGKSLIARILETPLYHFKVGKS